MVLSPKLLAKLESFTNRRLRLKGLMLVAQPSDDRKDLRGFTYYEEQGHN